MRFTQDKTQIKYNDFLTLTGIPPEIFEYKLGNSFVLDLPELFMTMINLIS